MKSKSILIALVICLFSLVLCLSGCNTAAKVTKLGDWSQPGMTEAEGHREHVRNTRLNRQNMMRDLDEVFHTNKPSKLTEMRSP